VRAQSACAMCACLVYVAWYVCACARALGMWHVSGLCCMCLVCVWRVLCVVD
jgi:hypothetical protein